MIDPDPLQPPTLGSEASINCERRPRWGSLLIWGGKKNQPKRGCKTQHLPPVPFYSVSSCLILQVQLFSCDQCVPITQSDIGGVWHDRAAVEADRPYIYQHIHCLHCSACLSVMFFGQDPTLSLCTYKVVKRKETNNS